MATDSEMKVSDAIFRVVTRRRGADRQPVDSVSYIVITSAEARDGWLSVTYQPVSVYGFGDGCSWGSARIPCPGTAPKPYGVQSVTRTGRTLTGLRAAQGRAARWPDGRFKRELAPANAEWLDGVVGAPAVAVTA